ncbi:MAG: EAL domain-containing protein [Acidobacteriota bacterium]|nr:EAL domain-containing protein [Acidobacteriota bacterium]
MKPGLPHILRIVLVALFYLGGVQFALLFITMPGEVTPIWPGAGVAYAAVLLYGVNIWPGIALGVLLGHLFAAPVPPLFLIFSLLGNTLGPVAAHALLKRYGPPNMLAIRVRNGFYMLLGGACLATVSTCIGVPGLVLVGMEPVHRLSEDLVQWWLGDLFAVLVCGPALTSLAGMVERRQYLSTGPVENLYEKLAWAGSLALVVFLFLWFAEQAPSYAAGLNFLPLALLIWSALRFSPIYTHTAVMVVNLGVLALAAAGTGGFPQPSNLAELSVLLLFLCVLSVVPLVISAANFERLYYERRLTWRAEHDRLTGLLNRTAFEERCNVLIQQVEMDAEPLALCYLDLDQFKVVNDTCGHVVGDNLIKQIACVLEQCLAEGDLIARLGGDEFAVLFRNCLPAEAETRAEKLCAAIENYRFTWENRLFVFTISIGVVPVRGQAFDRLLSLADTACYTAKELGRNRVKMILAEDLQVAVNRRQMQWVVRINEALEHDRFCLFCQSIAPVSSSGMDDYLHFEVLLRMLDQDGKILSPGTFIPAAERFHLMGKVDRWVVENTFNWLTRHPLQLARTSMCSINLSGPSLGDQAFLGFVEASLNRSGIPPGKVCFEITETAAIGDLSNAVSFIDSMRRLGCHFAIDDFGSGLASFSYLKSLDVDYVKIDGSFIRDIDTTPVDLAMVKSINDVGRLMGKKTIAEFVENESVRRTVHELGVDFAQGYAVDKPRPIEEFFAARMPMARAN